MWRAAWNQIREHPELASSGEHRLGSWCCPSKVESASKGSPGPQVLQLTASQWLKAPQPPAKGEAG